VWLNDWWNCWFEFNSQQSRKIPPFPSSNCKTINLIPPCQEYKKIFFLKNMEMKLYHKFYFASFFMEILETKNQDFPQCATKNNNIKIYIRIKCHSWIQGFYEELFSCKLCIFMDWEFWGKVLGILERCGNKF
jgi:hypothetical protein